MHIELEDIVLGDITQCNVNIYQLAASFLSVLEDYNHYS